MSKIPYSLDALRNGIEQCDRNIALFQSQIENERATQRQYKKWIEELKARETDSGPANSSRSVS